MNPADDAPKPDASYLRRVHPELLAHTLTAILLKNTDISPLAIQHALFTWRNRGASDGGSSGAWRAVVHELADEGHLPHLKLPILLKAAEYGIKRRDDKVFGNRAYHRGVITRTQLDDALAFQKQLFKALSEVKPLEKILVDDGYLDQAVAAELWGEVDRVRRLAAHPREAASVPKAAGTLDMTVGPDVIELAAKGGSPTTADDAYGNGGVKSANLSNDDEPSVLDMADKLRGIDSLASHDATAVSPPSPTREVPTEDTDDPATFLADVLGPRPDLSK